jgi:spectinomycin phosphotransferase
VERLCTCLREQYDLAAVTLEYLARGHDYNAGVYRVVSEQGAAYLLKTTSRPLYEPSCLVPRYLRDQGITAVVAPIPTKRGTLWARLEDRMDWTVIVYPFLDGDTSITGMTHAQWRELGAIFQRIHQVPPAPESPEAPAGCTSLRRETFDPSEYTRWVRAFETDQLDARDVGNESSRAVRASWAVHQSAIHTAVTSLETLAAALRSRTLPNVICHADLHPANLLRDAAGRVFVIDWDEVMLAPKERDFIFVREPEADAFWEGYGPHGVDWLAQTYFQYERVVQDLIECARDVCFRDDLGESTKAIVAQLFDSSFAAGSNLDAAYAAASHLPSDLSLPNAAAS